MSFLGLGVQQERQIAEGAKRLHRGVVGAHFASAVHPQAAMAVGDLIDADRASHILAVVDELTLRVDLIQKSCEKIPRHSDFKGHRRKRQDRDKGPFSPQSSQRAGEEQDNPENDIRPRQGLNRQLRPEEGDQNEPGRQGAGDSPTGVGRIEVSDAPAHALQSGHLEPNGYRKNGAHEESGDEHDDDGDNEQIRFARQTEGALEKTEVGDAATQEGDRGEAEESDQHLDGAEGEGGIPPSIREARAGGST